MGKSVDYKCSAKLFKRDLFLCVLSPFFYYFQKKNVPLCRGKFILIFCSKNRSAKQKATEESAKEKKQKTQRTIAILYAHLDGCENCFSNGYPQPYIPQHHTHISLSKENIWMLHSAAWDKKRKMTGKPTVCAPSSLSLSLDCHNLIPVEKY